MDQFAHTAVRSGDLPGHSYVAIAMERDCALIQTIIDPNHPYGAGKPRFVSQANGGNSFDVWGALMQCYTVFEKGSDPERRPFLEDSKRNRLVLHCTKRGDVVVSTETHDGKQEALVRVGNDHPHFPHVLNLFRAIQTENIQDSSKDSVLEWLLMVWLRSEGELFQS